MSQSEHRYFPKAILSVDRTELHQVTLQVQSGQLPADLQGSIFMVAPVGAIDSYRVQANPTVVLPSADGWTPLFNGDGMIYRIDFEAGCATLNSRIVKPPCYYADVISNQKFRDLRFKNFSFGRLSFVAGTLANIGVRNQLNTAFLPFKFATDAQERLLIGWDTGRPFEVDPQTLEVIAPLGRNDEWRSISSISGNPPFPHVMSTAHPCFDPRGNNNQGELFTVNVGKSVSTILWLSRSLRPRLKEALASVQRSSLKRKLVFFKIFLDILLVIEAVINWVFRLFAKDDDAVYLLRWDGRQPQTSSSPPSTFDRWRVVRESGLPLKIQQTLHQMGLTRDYIVLADTAFKFDLGEVLPFVHDDVVNHAEVLGVDLLDYPELAHTNIYVVRRSELRPGKRRIKARHFRIPFPMAHYVVDYDNPNGKIVLHAAHNCGTDPSETLRYSDQSAYDDPGITSRLRSLAGTVCGPTDVSRLGCHVIDVPKSTVTSYSAYDLRHTWSTAFYAYRGEQQATHFEDIYWNSWGCWTDILSQHVFKLYQHYRDRIVPTGTVDTAMNALNLSQETLLAITAQGIPANIRRVHIERNPDGEPTGLVLKDHYEFPPGYLGTSMQFVPKPQAQSSTAGYLVCVVISTDNLVQNNSEIWIFDAEIPNFGGQPICRLSHPQLNLGFTLHTTWLPPRSLHTPPSPNHYNVRQDYESRVYQWLQTQLQEDRISDDQKQQIEALFEAVYQAWEHAHPPSQ